MRGVKGCYVCEEDYLAWRRHGMEDISEDIDRLRARQPNALLAIDDLAVIFELDGADKEIAAEEGRDDHVQWAQEEDD